MLKRRVQSSEHDRDFACTCKRARLPQPKQSRHLYLALDDRDNACSLYKLDVLDAAHLDLERLPEPPVLRLEVPNSGDTCLFAALGTKIIALSSDRSPTLVHDTVTNALAVGSRRPPRALSRMPNFTVAAAGRLLALPDAVTQDTYYLQEEPAAQHDQLRLAGSDSSSSDEQTSHRTSYRRSWRSGVDKWTWSPTDSRSAVPFDPRAVTCHALHPDGRTVFVSVQRRLGDWTDHGTFSLDAGRGGGEWTRHGDWLLPFKGQAFFEAQLDAWVGLDERGYLCSCDGVSRRAGARRAAPARKVGKETLLREPYRQDKTRLDAALAYLGHARFCLVERAMRDGRECVLHVTTFDVRYDKHGDLTATSRRHVGSYLVSRHHDLFQMQAFFV